MSQQAVCDICGEMLKLFGFAMEIERNDKVWDNMSEGVTMHFCRKCVLAVLEPALADYLERRAEAAKIVEEK